MNSPAWFEAALDVGELLVLVATAAAPGTEHTGGGGVGGGGELLLLRLLLHPGLLAGLWRGRALHLLLLHVEVDGVLVVLVRLLHLGSLLLVIPRVQEHL